MVNTEILGREILPFEIAGAGPSRIWLGALAISAKIAGGAAAPFGAHFLVPTDGETVPKMCAFSPTPTVVGG